MPLTNHFDLFGGQPHLPRRVLLVEAARGAAAVYVCLYHVNLIGHLAESFKWGKILFYPFIFGQQVVFLFFFLSGFSIHYSSHNRPLETIGGIGHYYYLRLRRIYPIFLMAVGLSIALGALTSFLGIISEVPRHRGWQDLFFDLVFMGDIHGGGWHPELANNGALWSLSYEIPYYLVYPLFWRYCKKLGIERTFLFALLGSIVFILADCVQANHVSNVFSLYWLWACGALMAEWKFTDKSFNISPVAYYFVVFLCYAVSQSAEAVANPVIHWNLDSLVIGVVIFSTFICFQPMLISKRILAAGGIITLMFASLWVTRNVPTWGRHVFLTARLVLAAGFLAWFVVTGKNIASVCRILARPFLKAGAISYALYVIHTPILFFMTDILHYSGVSIYWLPVVLLVIFPMAWWLEVQFQPYSASWLDRMRAKLTGVFRPAPNPLT